VLALQRGECQEETSTLGSLGHAETESNLLRSRNGRADRCYKVGVRREFSAGVVLVRRMRRRWWFAAVRPQGKREGTWALPKGLVDAGETPAETARREGFEETGVSGRIEAKLGDVRYVYTWDGERVFKIVSFFLARAGRGRIGALPPGMEVEVAEARWLPLAEASALLAYRGERDMAEQALARLGQTPVGSDPI
jgi:8-oxo-dGTP pyrophosphatase MutT (NUDIX family)